MYHVKANERAGSPKPRSAVDGKRIALRQFPITQLYELDDCVVVRIRAIRVLHIDDRNTRVFKLIMVIHFFIQSNYS